MKRFLTFITALIALFVSLVNPSDAPALAASSTSNVYDSSFFDYDSSKLSPVSFYSSNNDSSISSEAKALNEAMTTYSFQGSNMIDGINNSALFVSEDIDVLPVITNELINNNLNPDYVESSDVTFLKTTATNEDDMDEYIGLGYQVANPIIYFDSTYNDDISFYIRPGFDKDALLKLISQYSLTGELTFLQVNNDPLITLHFNDDSKDFQLLAKEGVTITPESRRKALTGGRIAYYVYYKVTMPKPDAILKVCLLKTYAVESKSLAESFEVPSAMIFEFHSSVANYVYFYHFNIKSLSVINRTLSVDENSYTRLMLPNDEEVAESSTISAELVSMKLLFTGAIRSKTASVGSIKSTQLGSLGQQTVTVFSLPKTQTYECTFTSKSSVSGAWSYSCDDLPATASGQMTIQSLTFHPVIDGTVRTDVTFTQDFSKTNLYKYSFDVEKSARIYYYNWQGYYKRYSTNNPLDLMYDNSLFVDVASGPLNFIFNQYYNYHCFGFSFYFDDEKTEAIPNVKKIRLKWQCGYKSANSDPDSGGFYPNTNDEAKRIHIEEKTVNANKLANGSYALDKDGMFLADKDSCNKSLTQNGKYDYVIAKLRKRGDKTYNSYISQMAPLEISYETISGEVVRMIGNSKGLHVVTDELGNSIVVNSEGVAPDDEIYGIYEAEDGTKYPGIDKNGDGKITADEVINSDTGEGVNLANPNDTTIIAEITDSIKKFFEGLTNFFQNPRSWIVTILVFILLASIILAILRPSSLVSIFKAIKNAFQSLFSKAKKPKKKKAKKKARKKKK